MSLAAYLCYRRHRLHLGARIGVLLACLLIRERKLLSGPAVSLLTPFHVVGESFDFGIDLVRATTGRYCHSSADLVGEFNELIDCGLLPVAASDQVIEFLLSAVDEAKRQVLLVQSVLSSSHSSFDLLIGTTDVCLDPVQHRLSGIKGRFHFFSLGVEVVDAVDNVLIASLFTLQLILGVCKLAFQLLQLAILGTVVVDLGLQSLDCILSTIFVGLQISLTPFETAPPPDLLP